MLNTEQVIQKAETLKQQGQVAQAIVVLKNAIQTQPDLYPAWLLLSKYLFDSGYYQEAILVSDNAEQFDPLIEKFKEIQTQMQKSAFTEVEKIAVEMLKKQPWHPRAFFSLAHIYSLTPNPESSIDILNTGLVHNPANLTLRFKLIETYDTLGLYEEALKLSEITLKINKTFDSYWTLINLLHKYGQYENLLNICEKARELAKLDKLALSQLDLIRGEALRVIGDRESSVKVLQKSLAENPDNARAWWALADLKNYTFSDDDKLGMQKLLNQPNVDNHSKSIAAFSLAKATEQTGDWDAVMDVYNQANKLYMTPFDPLAPENEFKMRIEVFSENAVSVQSNDNNPDAVPIFIVGLPRSGSTLVEQILASHSQIEGTIEQPTLSTIERQAQSMCYKAHKKSLFDSMATFTADELSELGQAYINNGKLFRKENKKYFTDKNPFNFRHVGLIHKILPKAIIIDVRRNPLDCGFSLYKQYFSSGVDFSYDLNHIGAFYNSYLKLMDHWNKVLPTSVYTLQYEELIHSPEEQVRQLLDHIGVEFEESCLEFHKTKREVRTASSEQVRTPLNKKGIGSWRHAEKFLSPLKDSLGQETLERFKAYLS